LALEDNELTQSELKPAQAWILIAILCTAQVFVQIGAFFWPALLPRMMPLWALSNSEAGWITAIFYGAYMVSVPVLVTLTDRVDPKRIYLFGVALTVAGHLLFATVASEFWSALACRALTGVGWAGTYMTGLKLLADRVDARMLSRATAGHAASIGLSGAFSFAVGDWIAVAWGWQSAFLFAGTCSVIAWVAVAFAVPRQAARPKAPGAVKPKLFDFGPVFRNRSAMAYAFAYCIHTLEMSVLRGWATAFLAFAAAGSAVGGPLLSPAVVVTALGLAGTLASVMGNEASIRFGRRRLVATAMLSSIVLAVGIGILGPVSYWVVAGLFFVYGIVIWLDSSSLTAGTAGTAEPERRGATLAIHSMLGYAGGFIGPIMVGVVLDLSGGMSKLGWMMAFMSVAVCMAVALAVFWLIRPSELAGDRADATVKAAGR
jgi:predicted MFS family arabinose efflux permease